VIEQDVKLVFNQQVAVGTFLMGMRSPEIATEVQPGQFVMIRVGQGIDPLLRRPFSISGVREDLILVLYRVVGRGTQMLSENRKGDSLAVLGPLGKGFTRTHAGRHAFLVAGGMGIAPLAFLAGSMAPESHSFLSGFGSADQIVGTEALGIEGREISIATDDGSAGHQGLVTELLEKGLSNMTMDSATVFACGPLPMLKAVSEMTRKRDIPCQVALEASMACGLGACQGCAVKAAPGQDRAYWHVCQDGPVFNATALDWKAI